MYKCSFLSYVVASRKKHSEEAHRNNKRKLLDLKDILNFPDTSVLLELEDLLSEILHGTASTGLLKVL